MPTFVRVQELEHPIGLTGSFALRVTSADVELRGIDGDSVRLRASFEMRAGTEDEADQIFEHARLDIETLAGSFDASEPKDASSAISGLARLFGERGGAPGRVREMRVEAQVPRRADVRCTGVSADVTAVGLHGPQTYQTVSGDLVINEVSDRLRVKSVSGDVSIRATGPIELDATAVSGDLSVVAPRIGQLHANTVSGDVEIDGELAAGPGHRVETVSGDLALAAAGNLALEVRGLSTDVDISVPHRSQGSRDRRRYVIGDGGADLIFSSMSGDVSVRQSRRGPLTPPLPPAPPAQPEPTTASTPLPEASEADALEVLRALERGAISVDEASRRLEGR